jgi:drug/metabolite transporter superfamily protein YnfA
MSIRSIFLIALVAQVGIYSLQMWLREAVPSRAAEIDIAAMFLVVLNTFIWVWRAKEKHTHRLLYVAAGSVFIWIFGLFLVPALGIALQNIGLVALPTMKFSVIKGLFIGVLFSLPIPLLLSLVPRRRQQTGPK